jgi:hypothetical protein
MSRFASAAAALLIALASPEAALSAQSPNLLTNGDADAHRCTDDWSAQTPVPGWTVLRGAASVLCYSAFDHSGDTIAVPDRAAAGPALFGSPGADTAIEQAVDVAPAAADIDAGRARFTLSAWLGGWRDRDERAFVTAVFLDAAGHATGAPVQLGSPGPRGRGGKTAMVARGKQGAVPLGTRRIVVTAAFLTGGNSFHNAYADNLSLTIDGLSAPLAPAPLLPPPSAVPPLDHLFIVMMENTNLADLAGNAADAPFLQGLIRQGVAFNEMWANYHPSDQNYVAMVAGDTYKYGPVYFPQYRLTDNHVADLLENAGLTWKAYVQNMGTPCNLKTVDWYAPDDQPFAHFLNVIEDKPRCIAHLRDLKDLAADIKAGTLPNYAWIAADGWWDGEGAWEEKKNIPFSVKKQDAFLSRTFGPLLQSAAWRASRSLLVVTWDESAGWGWPDNRIATVLVGSPGLLRAGATLSEHYDGYSVLRTTQDAFGLPSLGRFDRYATPLDAAFATGSPAPMRDPRPSPRNRLLGAIGDAFGTVTVPTRARIGDPLRFDVPGDLGAGATLTLRPLGEAPDAARPPLATATLLPGRRRVGFATEKLKPGTYAVWLARKGAPPHRAPLMAAIQPALPAAVGLDVVGRSDSIREGSNIAIAYRLPDTASTAKAWIGVFVEGTASRLLSRKTADRLNYWVPAAQRAGETQLYTGGLEPGRYQAYLFADDAGGPVAGPVLFEVTPSLPR